MSNQKFRWLMYTFSALFMTNGLPSHAQSETLFPAGDQPDVVLMCHTYHKISVESAIDSNLESTKIISQAGIKKLLENQIHKHRIVIWLGKPIDWQSPLQAKALSSFESFANSLGYSRTIILGCRAFSMPTVFDSAEGGHQKPEAQPEPVVIEH